MNQASSGPATACASPRKDDPATAALSLGAVLCASQAVTGVPEFTRPRHLARPQAATGRSARARWFRVGHDHLSRLVADPVHGWATATHRGLDILDRYGVAVSLATGELQPYELVRRGRRLQRVPRPEWNLWLLGDTPSRWDIIGSIQRNERRWGRLCGLSAEPQRRTSNRLLQWTFQRWSADGSLQRMHAAMARALGRVLDAGMVRAVRATTTTEHGPQAVFSDAYNRCVADRDNLRTLLREAPRLLRLYSLLLPQGAGSQEPKQALKQAFLASGRPPWLWRAVGRLGKATIDELGRHVGGMFTPPLLDLVDFLHTLGPLHANPPRRWLRLLRCNPWRSPLVPKLETPHGVAMLRAHIDAWLAASPAERFDLSRQLFLVGDDLDSVRPAAPAGVRCWGWWFRHYLQWHALGEAERAREWDENVLGLPGPPPAPLRAGGVALHRLLRSAELHAEGLAMTHCVYAWRHHLADGSAAIYSVRRRSGGGHLGTAAIERDGSIEAYGPANAALPPKVDASVRDLLQRSHRRLWPAGYSSAGKCPTDAVTAGPAGHDAPADGPAQIPGSPCELDRAHTDLHAA